MIKIILIACIMLIYLAFQYGKKSIETELLRGFWNTTEEFNKDAGLQLFSFYIGDNTNNQYTSYVLMIESGDANNVLINEPIKFILKDSYFNMLKSNEYKEMQINFIDMETKLLPKKITMQYYPLLNKMILLDDTKIYAVFFKNGYLTELEHIKKEKLSKDDKDKTKTKKKDTKNDEKNKKKDMQKYTEKSKKTNGGSSACKIDVE